MAEALEAGFGADGQALCVERSTENFWQEDLVHAVLRALAQAQLFQHDGAFQIDVGVVETHAVGPVLQHQKTFADMLGIVGRQGQDVDRFVEAGVGVQVSPEFQANGLQVGHQFVFLEMGGTIKCHVLGKVRYPELVLVFQYGTRLDHQAQFQPLFRSAVLLDVIGQPVRQLSNGNLRTDGQRVRKLEFGGVS